ncbi:MAG: DUF3471 domain-containing protein [Cytophagaceae bacterium]|nr:DUF3471 domain-containing protein [Cytophagaceae bacterium]
MKRLLPGLLILGLLGSAQANCVDVNEIRPSQTAADSVDVQQYAGRYKMPEGTPIAAYTVTLENGEVFGEADGYGKFKLIRQKDADTYLSTSSYGSTIIFTRDATSKQVSGLKMLIQGNELIAVKEKK